MSKELLQQFLNNIINGEEEQAKEVFSQISTEKSQAIIKDMFAPADAEQPPAGEE